MKNREPIKPEDELATGLRLRGVGVPEGEIGTHINRAMKSESIYNALRAGRMTQALRAHLAALADKEARERYGDEVAAALAPWAEQARIEGLGEWLEKDGWACIEAMPEYAAKLEAAIVDAWKLWQGIQPRNPKPNEEEQGEPIDFITTKDGGLALVYLCRTREDPLPDADSDHAEHAFIRKVVAALDGVKGYFASGAYGMLTHGLENDEWLCMLAFRWASTRAKDEAERLKRREDARALDAAPAVHLKGRQWGRVPKVAAGMSWAFGGAGVPLSTVEIDGRTYGPAPDLSITPGAVVPAGYALLPRDHASKPHQTLLPLDMAGGDDAAPLPVALAHATQYAIAPAAAKLALLVLAAAHDGKGKLHKTTLRELAARINPWGGRIIKTHYETVTRGLMDLDRLYLMLPAGMSYRVFECPVPWRELTPEEYDTPLFVGMTKAFELVLADITRHAGKAYGGDFLFDVGGTMALPPLRGGLLRQYLRACAFWNSTWKPGTRGEPDPDRVPEVTTERWAAMVNYLPPAAVEYLRGKGKGSRRKASDSIKDALLDLEYLASEDGGGLVRIMRADRKAVRLLPPDIYLEAWHESRKGAARMR